MQGPRWTTVEAFLNDLPKTHCTVKPRDLFCTVCMRINHDVAFDCPLREVRQQRVAYEARPLERAPAPAPYDPALGESVPSDILAEGPVIEFAPSSEPSAKKRMKAKPLEKRGGVPAAPAPPPPAPAAVEAAPAATSDAEVLERELKAWDPEAPAADLSAETPPVDKPSEPEAPEKPAPPAESGEKRSRWRKR